MDGTKEKLNEPRNLEKKKIGQKNWMKEDISKKWTKRKEFWMKEEIFKKREERKEKLNERRNYFKKLMKQKKIE